MGGQVLSLREAYIQNRSLLRSLEPFQKFVLGGWVGGDVQNTFSDQPTLFRPGGGTKTPALSFLGLTLGSYRTMM